MEPMYLTIRKAEHTSYRVISNGEVMVLVLNDGINISRGLVDEEHGFRSGRVHVYLRLNVSSGTTDRDDDSSERVMLRIRSH